MGIKHILGYIRRSLEKSKNRWPLEKLIRVNNKGYELIMGYKYDWDRPVLFTEKLQWYKLNYISESQSIAVDKYLFKDYILDRLGEGYTLPLFGAWKSIDELKKDWDKLPQEFVLKSTLQSDGKYIKIIHDKSSVDLKELSQEVSAWFNPKNTLINSFCRAYHNATPRVIAEEYMEQVDNQLYDYKFFCFSGEPFCVYVATDHFPGQLSHISFYDLNWNKLDVRYGNHQNCDVDKPRHFSEMLDISKKLSIDYPFVRVDFFDTEAQLYVAELTFYPGGGLTPYYPESFNRKLGDLFIIPNKVDNYEYKT